MLPFGHPWTGGLDTQRRSRDRRARRRREKADWQQPVYKITYPNGKIYVGSDLTGTLTYFGSPSAQEQIAADLAAHRLDLTVRKQILWGSETATTAEVLAMERRRIRDTGANNPAIGYNLTPRWHGSTAVGPSPNEE